MAFPDAIERLFLDLLGAAEVEKAQTLAQNWATDEAAKKEVKRILANFHLDEYAIEAEAIRGLAPVLAELEVMLASLQFRKIRALRTLSDCYFNFHNDF